MDKCLWIVRDHPDGKRVTIYDGEDRTARVICSQIMSQDDYEARRKSTRKNRLVSVMVQEET